MTYSDTHPVTGYPTDTLYVMGGREAQTCIREAGPMSRAEQARFTTGTVPYTLGLEPRERTMLPGYDSGVLCMLLGLFVLLSYNFRHYSTFLKNFVTDLFSVRHREGTFEVRTFSEAGALASMVLVACLSEGIIVNSWLPAAGFGAPARLGAFFTIGGVTAVAVLYYLWQVAAYSLAGYVFASPEGARMWMKGFNASQTLLAFMLFIPALGVLFNPEAAPAVVSIAVTAYILARLVFIFKGFRLFFGDFGSLSYFILYLCTLEIVPLVALCRLAVWFDRLALGISGF
ncbi:MAG: DUF4271 domain-containing protein [Duncaniella sp.]|nr:DUF4271 domain-containing protein [Duncaniella sp.]